MLFVGCLMVGVGLGLLFDQVGAGTLIGMGIGFILQGLIDRIRAPGPLRRGDREGV